MVFSKDPHKGTRNVGLYRMQVFDSQTTGMHWHLHKVGARHYQHQKEQSGRMELAVCLGGDPALIYAATAPLPDQIDEILFTGFLRKKGVRLVVSARSAYGLWLENNIKNATLIQVTGLDGAFNKFMEDKADALAGLHRGEPGVRDRRRRQPRMDTRVVRRRVVEVRLAQRLGSRDIQPVADRRIDPERHPGLEAVVDDRGDEPALFRRDHLLLDHRGDDQDVVGIEVAGARTPKVDRLPTLLEGVELQGDQLGGTGVLGELVQRREEEAFERSAVSERA
jgi:hypothetical protein